MPSLDTPIGCSAARARLAIARASLSDEHDVDALSLKVVDAAILLMGASRGTLQTFDPNDNTLRMVASRGVSDDMLDHFRFVTGSRVSACGRALSARAFAIIDDVESAPELVGTRELELYRSLHIRTSASMPLRTTSGQLLGMTTLHWDVVQAPSNDSLRTFGELSRHAADLIVLRAQEERVRTEDSRQRYLGALHMKAQIDDLDTMFRAATQLVARHFDAERVSILELHAATDTVTRHAYYSRTPTPEKSRLRSSVGFEELLALLRAGRTIIVDDTRECHFLPESARKECLDEDHVGFAVIPLLRRVGATWLIKLGTSMPRRWTPDEIMLLHETAELLLAAHEWLDQREPPGQPGRFVWEIETQIIQVDAQYRAVLGAPESALTQDEFRSYIYPPDLDGHRQRVNAATDPSGTGILRSDFRVPRAHGALDRVRITGRVLFDGDPRRAVRCVGTIVDLES